MEPELFDAGVSDQLAPPFFDVAHLEYLARASLARLTGPTLQDFHGFDVQRDVTLPAGLGVLRLDGEHLCFPVDVGPCHRQQLTPSHTGVHGCKNHGR